MPDPAPTDTRAQVKHAADALLAEGIRPTVVAVRERIGRGSATTINDALKDWWWELAERLSRASARPDIPEPVIALASQLWDAALEAAAGTFARYRAEADAVVEATRAEAQTALLARQQVEARAMALEQRLAEIDLRRIELERHLAAETERNHQAVQRIEELRGELERQRAHAKQLTEHHAQELTLERARYDSLERRLVGQLDEQKTTRERLEKLLAVREAEWRTRGQDLQTQAEAARAHASQAAARIADLESQLVQLAAGRDALQSEKENLAAQTATLQVELSHASERLERLEHELSSRDRNLETLRLEYGGTAKQFHNVQIQLAVLEAENRTLKAALSYLGPNTKPR